MHRDAIYWRSLRWPAAPNQSDVEIYKNYCKGRVLLLGSTQLLLPLCTEAWDLKPKYADKKILDRDWFTLNEYWDTVIGDGIFTFGEQHAKRLLSVVLPNCGTFLVRSFLNPTWKTKYAIYFPRFFELDPSPQELIVNNIYSFFLWNRKN